MSQSKDSSIQFAKRSVKLLKVLQNKTVRLETSSKQGILLLVVEGERTLKCPSEILTNWLKSEFVRFLKSDSNRVSRYLGITEAGIAYVKRSERNDYAEQHRQNKAETITISQVKHEVIKNLKESPLSALFHQKTNREPWLNASQFDAGERLRADFEFSQLSPRITSSWDPTARMSKESSSGESAGSLSDRVLDARQRLNNAIEAVGPELSTILLDVCCFLKGMEQIERERQWPRRSAKLLLRSALSALARHYDPHQFKSQNAGIRQWGTDDYRPKLN